MNEQLINTPDYDPYSTAEGSTRLWNRNYVLVMLANFLLFFSLNCLMPILPIYLSEQFHADKDVIGDVMSSFVITALIIRPFSGYIVDRFPRKTVLVMCFLAFMLFNVGYIIAGTVTMFAIVRALQGLAFGATSVANSTVAIDVLPSCRRSEGIGYYGISNNLAMAIGPSVALFAYRVFPSITYVFILPIASALAGCILVGLVKNSHREINIAKEPLSLDRFYILKSIPEGITLTTFSFASATLLTYVAIYSKQELGLYSAAGIYFLVLSAGLIISRILTNSWVRKGYIVRNVKLGMLLITIGFLMFVGINSIIAYYISAFIIGIGYGTMCPSYQSMFINLAPNSRRGTANSSYLTAWDVGAGIGIFSAGYIARQWSYHTVYWLCTALCLLGMVAYFAITARHFSHNKLR